MLQTWLPVAQVMDCSRASTSFSFTFGGLVKGGPESSLEGEWPLLPSQKAQGTSGWGQGSACTLKATEP